MAEGEHYFSASPASEAQRRPLHVALEGRHVELETAASVFSADRLDTGTAVLLDAAGPPPDRGDLLDVGCGWGPIALTMALRAPAARVWAVDVNERARALTAANAARLGLSGVRAVTPEEAPAVALAAIWSNPPVRVGKDALHALLLHWLPRLAPGASAHLVVARDLGADSLLRWIGERGEAAREASEAAGASADGAATSSTGVVGNTGQPLPGGGWSARRTASRKGYRVLRVDRD